MIVMDPNGVFRIGDFQHGRAERLIHPIVGPPKTVLVTGVLSEVMEKGPDGAVREPVVIIFQFISG